jgi:acyl-homoserine-lactone acylase
MGVWVLSGNSNCRLDKNSGAPQQGIFAGKELPLLRRYDYVQNSNDSAWLTNPRQLLVGFPPIVSKQDYQPGSRTRVGVSMVSDRLSGSDGLPGSRFDMPTLQSLAFSNRGFLSHRIGEELKSLCGDDPLVELDGSKVDVTNACAALRKWDGDANLTSIGVFVGSMWIGSLAGMPDIWSVPFSSADPVNTPSGLDLQKPENRQKLRLALARVAQSTERAGIDASSPWGQTQYAEFGSTRVPIHGVANGDTYNVAAGEVQNGGIRVRFGATYVFSVYFDDSGPHAEGFLTYSQSSDPESRHFADQASRFSKLNWISLPFTEAQIRQEGVSEPLALRW